jgi:prepilin-type N-terminal cleavage/methylation domain-containing protein
MRGGQKRQKPLGYTIIEVLIVLAVSGVMFVIAATFISGKQEKTAFTAGTNDMASQIQGIIEQVIDGHYSDVPLQCTFNGGNTNVNVGTSAQGTNDNCVFLGKLLRFTPGSDQYEVASLAGGRLDPSSLTPITLQNVDPKVITSLTTQQIIPQSLTVKCMEVTDVTTGTRDPSIRYFGFTQGLGTAQGQAFQAGAQSVSMVYSTGSVDANVSGGTVHYASAATIQLTDNTQLVNIDIGGAAASQLSVNVQHLNPGAPCP